MNTTQRPDQQTSADRRRRELLEAADRVVLRDGPHASMNAIAAEAGITKPILYRHFGDKGGLYAALAVRHTDALLASLRAALDAPAQRPAARRGHPGHRTWRPSRHRPQVYRFLMHPAESAGSPGDQSEQGFDVGKHSAPLLRRMGEELAQVIEERLDVGPGTQQWLGSWGGTRIVGMMHAAGDSRGRRTCPAPGRSWSQPGRPARGPRPCQPRPAECIEATANYTAFFRTCAAASATDRVTSGGLRERQPTADCLDLPGPAQHVRRPGQRPGRGAPGPPARPRRGAARRAQRPADPDLRRHLPRRRRRGPPAAARGRAAAP
ncbi:hypothetical protein STENM327S_01624 [Streptomyces tendae]